MKKIIVFKRSIGTVIILIILFGFTQSGCNSSKPIKIGFIAGISGRVADLGMAGSTLSNWL